MNLPISGAGQLAQANDHGSAPSSRWVWAVGLLSLAMVAAAVVLLFLNRESVRTPDEANAIEIVVPIGFAIFGPLVASRQPSNALGWIFAVTALAMAVPALTGQYTRYAVLTEPGVPFSPWIPLFGTATETLVYPAGLAPLAMLLTPNGRFLSPRWRWVAVAGGLITAVLVIFTITELQIANLPVANPAGLITLAQLSSGPVGIIAFVLGLVVLALAAASMVVRLRRADGDERQQLRWVAYATALAVAVTVLATMYAIAFLDMATSLAVLNIVITVCFGLILPAGFGIAMLRYRLYDLDLLVNRTVLYGAVSVVLAVAFFAANVLAQQAVETLFDARSDLVAAALGVAAGLAFGPMRRAARPLVDALLPARSKLTLLFTDIVESTQAIVDLGDEAWRDVLFRYRAAVRRELSHYRGREVNTAGDAFFAVFARPRDGVGCALAMRDVVAELGLRVRTGVHVGEVELRGEQVSGLAVHAAARIMSLAGPDEVLVSGELAEALDGRVGVRNRGPQVLRGVPGEYKLFEVG
jgi:class 3 adenylate cyclase